MDLHSYAEKFYDAKIAERRAENTLISYRFHIGRFLAWCATNDYRENDLWGTTGAEVIEEYQIYLAGLSNSPFTIYGNFRSLRALYKWINKRFGKYDENPFHYLTAPKMPDPLPKGISYDQTLLLLHSIKPELTDWLAQRDKLIIKLLFWTGIRASELLSVKVGDVDTAHRRFLVHRWKIQKDEYIPVARSLQTELATWVNHQRPPVEHNGLWPSYVRTGKRPGPPLHYEGLKEMLRRRCQEAGLPVFRPHAFRHGCAIHIIQRGGDISLVQKLLGHRELTTSQIYLRFNIDQVTSMYDRVFD